VLRAVFKITFFEEHMELKTYEGMFMLDPTKATQEWDNIKKQVVAMMERRGGTLINARKWGERKLAYEITGHKRAAYLLMYFQMPSENVAVFRKDLQLSEIVMRILILSQEKTTISIKEEEQQPENQQQQPENQQQQPENQGQSPENQQPPKTTLADNTGEAKSPDSSIKK
jgi:small subunit ribosomal protein S6